MDVDLSTLPEEFEFALIPSPWTGPFRLLALPAELWLHILAFAVIKPHPIEPTLARHTKDQTFIVAQTPITRTCRVLRAEGLPLFYGLNCFVCVQRWATACTRNWLVATGDRNRKTIGRFVFHADFESGFWVRRFGACGIEMEVESLEERKDRDDRRVHGRWLLKAMDWTTELNEAEDNIFETLLVTFS